jgi:hypothetical protein
VTKLPDRPRVLICGGGSSAHVAVALLGSLSDDLIDRVDLYTPLENEAQKLRDGGIETDGVTLEHKDKKIKGAVMTATSSAASVVPEANLIIIALPATFHEGVLRSVAPYIRPGTFIGALCARSGFDWACHSALGNALFKTCVIFGFQTLPWACRMTTPGANATVLGKKDHVDMCTLPAAVVQEDISDPTSFRARLGTLLDLSLKPVPNFMTLTLGNVGQLIHPGVMYGRWSRWDGTPIPTDQKPLFYQGVDEFTASILNKMSTEVQAIKAAAEEQTNQFWDLSHVDTLYDWLNHAYPTDIQDSTSLQSCFNTNKSYQGLTHPMLVVDGDAEWLRPDFKSRYLSEDGPYGLVVTCGLGRILRVDTPTIDMVIEWMQKVLNKQFLVDKKLTGRDLGHTRAPQRYGIKSIQQIVAMETGSKPFMRCTLL